jgi:hypothetical protein
MDDLYPESEDTDDYVIYNNRTLALQLLNSNSRLFVGSQINPCI